MKTVLKLLVGIVILMMYLWISPFAKKQSVATNGWQQLIPSNKLDSNIVCLSSNNNLDAVEYNDRYYVAFRTAPHHFASDKATLYIMSSTDFENWQYENSVHLGNDLREPRFVVNKDTLFFYYFEGGLSMRKFEPLHIWMSYKTPTTDWQDSKDIELDGFVPWRLRSYNDTIFLSAYYGVNLYTKVHAGNQRLYYSTNGASFQPISKVAQVPDQGVEEGEFIFDSIGNIWGTLRMEGDGAMTFFASKDSISKWKTTYTKHKYDSALLFEHLGEHYLISRRNMDGTSKKSNCKIYNLIRYSLTKKRTALFHFNKKTMVMDWIKDFPSTGDNSFPGIIPIDKHRYYLLNYSSDILGKEKNWIKGQLGKTNIYYTILDMQNVLKVKREKDWVHDKMHRYKK